MTFPHTCAVAADALNAFAERAENREGPVIRQEPMAVLAERLDLKRLIADGGLSNDTTLRGFLADYLDAATRLAHPRYMAHQVAAPQPLSVVAALVGSFINNPMAIYEMGPSAATVEFAVVNWMLEKTGWLPAPWPGTAPETDIVPGGGVLTHGGSLANLTALAAARAKAAPTAWSEGTPANLVLIAPPSCHYSVARAAAILGLGARAVKAAPVDDDGRIIPARLGGMIDDVRAQGAVVMAVVANACSTAAGLYDPLRAIGEICRNKGVWLHVDGAHGASALVSPHQRHLLDGVELADSLVWDAHKMLRTPALCAAVLVRDHRHLDTTFQEEASYLFHDKDQPGFDFVHRTVECTKAGLGLKLFFALAAEGEAGMAAYLDRQSALARDIASYFRQQADVEVAVEPESNIVCFRMPGDDSRQLVLRKRLTEKGDFYISSTEFRGRRWLRLALMNPATTLSDVAALLAELRRMLPSTPSAA